MKFSSQETFFLRVITMDEDVVHVYTHDHVAMLHATACSSDIVSTPFLFMKDSNEVWPTLLLSLCFLTFCAFSMAATKSSASNITSSKDVWRAVRNFPRGTISGSPGMMKHKS